MRTSRIPAVLTLAAAFLLAPVARAAVDAFIWFEDGSIKGDSKDPQHQGWIEISSFQIEEIRQAAAHANGAGGGTGKVSFQGLHITKKHDSASAKLKLGASTGAHYPAVVLSMRKAGGDPGYLTVKLGDVTLSGYQGSADRPTESLSLNFTKIEFKNIPMGPPATDKSSAANAALASGAVVAALQPPTITGVSASAPTFGTNATITVASTGACANARVDWGTARPTSSSS